MKTTIKGHPVEILFWWRPRDWSWERGWTHEGHKVSHYEAMPNYQYLCCGPVEIRVYR